MFKDNFDEAEEVFHEFAVTDEQKAFVKHIIFAAYSCAGYEGEAHVVFEGTDGKYYEVNGSHCSCHGLEDQWEPEETTLDYFLDLVERKAEYDQDLIDALVAHTYMTTRNVI